MPMHRHGSRNTALLASLFAGLLALGCSGGTKPVQTKNQEKAAKDAGADKQAKVKQKIESMQKQMDLLSTPKNSEGPKRENP
jgi:uncharacterized protein HemX